jgi:hypothetical protein
MFGLLAIGLTALVARISGKTPHLYYNSTADSKYPVDLFDAFFTGKKYLVVTDKNDQPLEDNSAVLISPPISNETKYSHSLMFWPMGQYPIVKIQDGSCLYNLGLNAIGDHAMMDFSASLVNSMTYFEVIKAATPRGENNTDIFNYFMAINLDKTSSGYKLTRQVESQAPVFNQESKCDSVLFGCVNKTYFVCWKLMASNTATNVPPVYRLEIKLVVWDPRKGLDISEDRRSLLITEDQYIDLKRETHKTELKAIAMRSVSEAYFDIALYFFKKQNFFIIRVRKDKFAEFRFPVQAKGALEELWIPTLKSNDTNTSFDIYDARYIDGNMFLLTQYNPSFNKLDSTTYGDVYYFDATKPGLLMNVGKGIVVAVRKGMDEYRHPILKDFLIITSCVELKTGVMKNKLSIQVRKYYQGYIYGDQQFELSIRGDPTQLKGFTSQMYFVFIDQGEKATLPNCTENSYFNSTVYIAPLEKPLFYKELIRFKNPVQNPRKIMVSENNNLLYLRSSYKLEVFNLMHIMKDVKIPEQAGANLDKHSAARVFVLDRLPGNLTTKSVLDAKPLQKLWFPKESLEKGEFVTLEDLVKRNKYDKLLQVDITEQQSQYKYPALPDELTLIGNFLVFKSNSTKDHRAEMSPFESSPMLLSSKEVDNQTISKLYGMTCNGRRFVLISYQGDTRNVIYIQNLETKQYEPYMTLYDNRMVTGMQEISNEKYLLHIEGLLYELYILNRTLNPLFKSNDICGEVLTSVDHNELGPLTICGGGGVISIFASTNTDKTKIDLSTPIDNSRINPSLAQAIKQDSISFLFSSINLPNRFGSMSRIIYQSNMTASMLAAKKLSMIKIRLFEISSSKQFVDIMPESENEIFFDLAADKVIPYLIGDRLALLVRFSSTISRKEDFIYVYHVDATFKLELEKTIKIPSQFIADFEDIKPMVTFLPVNKTLQVNYFGPKLLIMFSVEKRIYDISKNFDFFDFGKFIEQNKSFLQYKKIIGVFDPSRSSLDCIKLLELPDSFTPVSFGHYYLDVAETQFGQGALIAGSNGIENRVYFMNDHSMIVEFHILSSFESFFTSKEIQDNSYTVGVTNMWNKQSRSILIRLNNKLAILPNYDMEVSPRANFLLDLNKSTDEMKKKFMLYQDAASGKFIEDTISGVPYQINFQYDSKIEQKSNQITATLTYSVNDYQMKLVQPMIDLVLDRTQYSNSTLSTLTPLLQKKIEDEWLIARPSDYASLLYLSRYIGFPRCQLPKGNTDTMPNPNFQFKRRCTKFYYVASPSSLRQEELLACLELLLESSRGSVATLGIFIYDERNDDGNLYKAKELEPRHASLEIDISKVPLADIELRATMNYLVVLRTSSITGITYHYDVFRIKKERRLLNRFKISFYCDLIFQSDIWSYQVSFTNFFYRTPGTVMDVEKFCFASITKVEKLAMSCYCFLSNMKIPTAPTSIRVEIFNPFRYQDIDTVIPKIAIYSKSLSPMESLSELEEDPHLYVMVTFPTSLSTFVRVDTTSGSMAYVLLCNPFDGYLFMNEIQSMDGKYFVRLGVRKNETVAWFYNLPSLYAKDHLQNYQPFYSGSEIEAAFDTEKQLSCLKPSFVSMLPFKVDQVFPLCFHKGSLYNKATPDDNIESFEIVGRQTEFTVGKSAIELLLYTKSSNKFTRLEFTPSIQVIAKSQLLFSDRVQMSIMGMRNRTVITKIEIKSGSFTNPGFLFRYILPLIGVILGLVLLNWIIRFVFYNQDPDDPNDSRLPSIFRVKEFARRISNLKKRVSLDTYGPRDTQLSSMSVEASVLTNYRKRMEEDRIRKENALAAKRAKEILGNHSDILDPDLAHENVELATFRKLRDIGKLKVDIVEEVEKTEVSEVTPFLAEQYAEFKDFMENEEAIEKKLERRERKLKKNLLQFEEKKPKEDKEGSDESNSDSDSSSGSSELPSNRLRKGRRAGSDEKKSDSMSDEKEKNSSDDKNSSEGNDETDENKDKEGSKKEIVDFTALIAPSLLQNLNSRFDPTKHQNK